MIIKGGCHTLKIFNLTDNTKLYHLYVGDFIGEEKISDIHELLHYLLSANDNDYIRIFVASNGGDFQEFITMRDVITSTFGERIGTVLHYGFSAGAYMFLMGTERIIFPYSQMMIHSYSGSYTGKRNDIVSSFKHTDKEQHRFLKSQLKPYFSKKEIKKIKNGKDFWLNSAEMITRGIATGFMDSKGNNFSIQIEKVKDEKE